MKILMVMNKTLSNDVNEWVDSGHTNLYLPLKELGHKVYWYDTVRGDKKPLKDIVDDFKPDLMWCCMTGDQNITPNEPWEDIIETTRKGNCKTFNWFCDDSWRFNTFSSKVCSYFHMCATSERRFIDKFNAIGYNSIILGAGCPGINFSLLSGPYKKEYEVSFCGHLSNDRKRLIDILSSKEINIKRFHGLEYKEMLESIAKSYIGINFSKNAGSTQMKQRVFEVTAAGSLLFTEYHDGIEEFFEIDKEIVCFKNDYEMYEKLKVLLNNKNIIEKISQNGHKRFLKEYDAKVRLPMILNKIMKGQHVKKV